MPPKSQFLMLAVIVTATYAFAPTGFAQEDSKQPAAAIVPEIAPEIVPTEGIDVQGEYTGELTIEGEKFRAAVQVFALGDNNYKAAIFHGGLPGDGWIPTEGSETVASSEPQGAGVTFRKDNRHIDIIDGAGQVFLADELIGQLDRVVRESKTLGGIPPEGALVLFEGTSGDHFEAQDGGDPVVDGVLRQGIISKQKFGGDFSLHLEFKLPFEPAKSGQARGNSGLYLQGRYEVQMLDSFGLEGLDNECGGIYGVKKPDVNMCFPPESWQTYDIDFRSARWDGETKSANARISVRHNGVVIHDDVEIPAVTTAAPSAESAEPGFLYLQNHGSPVRYRNIWVIQK